MDSSKVKIKASKEILISMTNITVAMKEAEDNLASNNLAELCKSLKKVEQISNYLRREIEIKYGVVGVIPR
jgi:hypothetical protein